MNQFPSDIHLPAAFCPSSPPTRLPGHPLVNIYSIIIALAQGHTQMYLRACPKGHDTCRFPPPDRPRALKYAYNLFQDRLLISLVENLRDRPQSRSKDRRLL